MSAARSPIENEEPIIKNYFALLQKKTDEQYAIAKEAREKGKDIVREIECPPTLDLADRTENIIGPPGVAKRYRELYEELKGDRNRAIFQLFREIIEQKLFPIPDDQKRLEQAIKTSLVLVTEGVVVAPLDGVPHVKISRNPDGSKYVDIYFAGPIRAAGGTATVFPLILGDYARSLMQLDRYKPTEDEVERYVEEVNVYDEIITRQYKLKDDDVRKIARGCPVCINGEPTEEREVSAYKDLERIPSNRIRGGMCLVISEGVGLKAMKIMGLAKILGLNWSWLEEIIKIGKGSAGGADGDEKEIKPNFSYLSRIAAGRPIFSYPSRYGGLRLRYGRARNTCVMAKGIHPATMYMLDEFIAVGTQTKMERPGKSAEMFPVDTIAGPIVKLAGGEVRKIKSLEEAKAARPSVKEIIFLGDVLIALGDFRKTAHPLMPAGYCEEWWKLELEAKAKEQWAAAANFNIEKILAHPYLTDQSTAIELSLQLGVALHPNYLHYYTALTAEEACELVGTIRAAQKIFSGPELEELQVPHTERTKSLLEKIGLPHTLAEGKICVGKDYAYSFFKTFGGTSVEEPQKDAPVLEMLSRLAGIPIKDKAGTFIGCRMGRPEAAKPRKMIGDPMVLFPIGHAGGNIRSINKAAIANNIEAELAYFINPETGRLEDHPYSLETGQKNELMRKCPKCAKYSKFEKCDRCGTQTEAFLKRKIDLRKMLEQSARNLKVTVPPLIKGVKGLINIQKVPEPLEKGILRARQGLHIFRDGTIRYELLNAPLTHFKPKEIGMSVEKAHELGYTHDFEGRELVSDGQMCELFVQDMVVNEGAGEFFVRVTKFIDEELEKFYGMPRHYNYERPEQMIGELFLGLAPHTSAGVLCRIIGYTKAKLNFAHPYFHLAKRRNCFPASTPVLIEQGGKPKLVPIGSFDNGISNDIIPLKGINTYTVLANGKLKKEKVKALFKRKSPKKLLKIKSKLGCEVVATYDHEILVFDGKKISRKKAAKIKPGDQILTLFKLGEKKLKSIITDYKKAFGAKSKIFEKVEHNLITKGKNLKKIGCFAVDKIRTIEEIVSGEEYVYDLMVEGNKTFIAGFGNLGVFDCDGDQDSIMLAMDALLNFSRLYLPSTRGGRMDAPLVFTTVINPQEIDDEVYEVETCTHYPIELYEKSLIYAEPDSVAVPIVKKKIGKPGQYTGFGFTHATSEFDAGPKESRYISFKSMEDKMRAQAAIQGKIRAVDEKDALERVMMSHFMPDIIGNTRAFSRQSFRCSACNAKYRRIPLAGKCLECGSQTLILTIAQGSVRKYLTIAKDLIQNYGLSDYLRQRIALIEKEIDSVFTGEKEKVSQKSLADYA